MRCFACDIGVSGDDLDRPTQRFYCNTCFAPTIEEQFQQARKEFNESLFKVETEFDEPEKLDIPDEEEEPF